MGRRPGGRWGWGVVFTLLAALSADALAAQRGQEQQEESPFPHEDHVGLFPVCDGCHSGIPEGDREAFHPGPADCASCHDGVERGEVDWSPPPRPASSLDFTHEIHAAELVREGEGELACAACHSAGGGELRMLQVRRGRPGACLSCHGHEADSHYDDAACATCHVRLGESGLGPARLEALPEPGSHDNPAFLAGIHADEARADPARCATCHVRDRCASCHVDAGLQPIESVAPAPAGMELPAFEARYPTPEDHLDPAWLREHDVRARRESCGTCHTRNDCASCHREPLPDAAASLPARGDVRAPGAALVRTPPESHRAPAFVESHATPAAASSDACATCHTESFCTTCHAGSVDGEADARGPDGGTSRSRTPARPSDDHPRVPPGAVSGPIPEPVGESGFHPPNYSIRHAADAWGRTQECASCHSTEVFCRNCHMESGVASQGRPGPGYHNAVPLWLFRHGQAARQGLESCASCHSESQCLRCHSQVGAFRVSPHGPDFDAERARQRNPVICFACHLSDPLAEPPP